MTMTPSSIAAPRERLMGTRRKHRTHARSRTGESMPRQAWRLASEAMKCRWPRLTAAHLAQIDGARQRLVDCVTELYDIDCSQAEIEVRRFELSLDLPQQLTGTPGSGGPHGPVGGPPSPPVAHPGPFPARRAVSCTAFESSPAGGW
jgi:hypothetical protein